MWHLFLRRPYLLGIILASSVFSGCAGFAEKKAKPTETGNIRIVPLQTQALDARRDPSDFDPLYQEALACFDRLEWVPGADAHTVSLHLVGDDSKENCPILVLPRIRLGDWIPKLSAPVAFHTIDALLLEYSRREIEFRRDLGQFLVHWPAGSRKSPAFERLYQIVIANNCLEPGKWELILSTWPLKDRDKQTLQANPHFAGRHPKLAHYWFQVPEMLYDSLWAAYNPSRRPEVLGEYDSLSTLAEALTVTEALRCERCLDFPAGVLEVGHRSGRRIEVLDPRFHPGERPMESFYKNLFGLVRNGERFATYADILAEPIRLSVFGGMGVYSRDQDVVFDLRWLGMWNQVSWRFSETDSLGRFAHIDIGGPQSTRALSIRNVDLARLNKEPYGFALGWNSHPKRRLFRDRDYSPRYRLIPEDTLPVPVALMWDKRIGKWLNNQREGIEQIVLSWEGVERNILRIELLSYERILPLWMARVAIDSIRLAGNQVGNARYSPSDPLRYPNLPSHQARRSSDAASALLTLREPAWDTVTIGFDALAHADSQFAPHDYRIYEAGFLLQAGALWGNHPFRSLGSQSYGYGGSSAITAASKNGLITLYRHMPHWRQQVNPLDHYFQVFSLDIAGLYPGQRAKLAWVGVRPDGSTAMHTAHLTGEAGSQKVTFPDWGPLSELRWLSQGVVFDNLRVLPWKESEARAFLQAAHFGTPGPEQSLRFD